MAVAGGDASLLVSQECAVLDYLCSGVRAGMKVPDPADPALQTIRVLA